MKEAGDRYVSGGVELRCGSWQERLADVVCSVLLGDPPYSDRTHEGQRAGDLSESTIDYAAMTPDLAHEIAVSWAPRVSDWAILFCDHIAFHWHEAAWSAAGWHVFAPVYWVKPDAAPRKVGDGPTCSVEQIMVARPFRWPTVRGSRRGHYVHPVAELRGCGHSGSKPLGLMRDLVEDYATGLIVDPFAGLATTLRAADEAGLPCVGAEISPETYRKAVDRLVGMGPAVTKHGQANLFVEGNTHGNP